MRVGLISDTHGLVRPEAFEFLRGSDLIIHAGDICEPRVLEVLAALAPVTAVRGNNDRGEWAAALRHAETILAAECSLHVVHDIADLTIDPVAAGVQAVVTGHSHQPRIERRNGVLFVNPGSAGPRRFRLPVSVGELLIERGAVTARTVELEVHHHR